MDAESEIRRILALYCHRLDDGQFDEWAGLFAVDGEYLANGDQVAFGHAGLVEWAENHFRDSGNRGRHLVTNVAVDVSGDTANAVSNWIFVARSPVGPIMAGTGKYRDDFIRTEGGWTFQRRDVLVSTDWITSDAHQTSAPRSGE